MSFNLNAQYATMSPVLPFDITALIIDIVGENNDTNLLKELALISHSFHQICSKHIFATVELHDVDRNYHVASSKKGFVKLLRSRPDVVKYIRKLTYHVNCNFQSLRISPTHPSFNNDNHHLLSSVLPNLLRTISHLNCLTISASQFDWNTLDSSLTSAFLYLMHLPTINHIDLSYIQDFPLSSFTPSVNLRRLDISYLRCFDRSEEDGSPEIVILPEWMPKIREFHTSESALVTTKLLHAKKQDGRPAFDFMDLRRLSTCLENEQNVRYLMQNAKFLETLHLTAGRCQSLVRLYDILSPRAHTLKVLDLSVSIYNFDPLPLAGLCEGLEAMAGHNNLEALSFEIHVDEHEPEDSVGFEVQRVEKVLVKPGWSALRQVSLKVTIACWGGGEKLYKTLLKCLPEKYLSHLLKLESVAFNFSVDIDKCIIDSPASV